MPMFSMYGTLNLLIGTRVPSVSKLTELAGDSDSQLHKLIDAPMTS